MERTRRLVFAANGVPAIVADAKPVARQCELGRLRLHRSFSYDLAVDVQLHVAERFMMRASSRSREFHAERVFAGLQLLSNSLVLREGSTRPRSSHRDHPFKLVLPLERVKKERLFLHRLLDRRC